MADAQKPHIKLPAGFATESDFLEEFRTTFQDDDSADLDNHEAGVEDLQFVVGDQWDPDIQNERQSAHKPTLTINRMPAFIGQVLGRRLQNDTQIKIAPNAGSTKQVADVREGLVRAIQKDSDAAFAYDNALLGAVTCGIGNFQIDLDYEDDDVWEQCIGIKPIHDHFSVVWDRTINEPSGRDADHVNVVEQMPWAKFEKKWPWARPADMQRVLFAPELQTNGWWTNSDVRVVANWRMQTKRRTLALLDDNSTHDITEVTADTPDGAAVLARIKARPDGTPFIRHVDKPYAQRYICSGTDILEGPYNLPIDRVPVFRVPGWEIRIGSKVHRWGLVRFLKDPQRLHNFWRSVIAEKIMRSPKSTWLASNTAVQGREAAWRDSANSDDPLLIWNQESGQKPERVAPVEIEGALIEQAQTTAQDMKDVSNIHEANLGMPSNEVSGRGIEERVAVSENGTALYHKNLERAIKEAGRVTDALIPVVYDTARVVKITLPNNKDEFTAINDVVGDDAKLDITKGKYTVTAETGRSYETKRQESSESILGLAQSMPNVLGLGGDIVVEAMDWPEAERLARRIRRSIPPQLLDPEERTPEQVQQMQASAQAAQTAGASSAAAAAADVLEKQSAAALNAARAENYQVTSQVAPAKLQNESMTAASEATSREVRDNLEAIKVATGA